jgi:hypothetical protein
MWDADDGLPLPYFVSVRGSSAVFRRTFLLIPLLVVLSACGGGRPVPTAVPTEAAVSDSSQTAVPSFVSTSGDTEEDPTFSITSHSSGATVDTSRVQIQGTGSAGARIVHDISFAPDQDATVGDDRRWSMVVDLLEGANDLTFRIGDDKTTAVTISLVYAKSRSAVSAAGTAAPTDDPAPDVAAAPGDWDFWVCEAVKQVDDSGNHVAALGQAATDYDVELMVEEGKKAVKDAREALDALAAAPAWKPGSGLVTDLKATADYTIKGVNLISLGAQSLDADTINEGSALIDKAVDRKFAAAAELVDLEAKTGVGCF